MKTPKTLIPIGDEVCITEIVGKYKTEGHDLEFCVVREPVFGVETTVFVPKTEKEYDEAMKIAKLEPDRSFDNIQAFISYEEYVYGGIALFYKIRPGVNPHNILAHEISHIVDAYAEWYGIDCTETRAYLSGYYHEHLTHALELLGVKTTKRKS